jgi:hypothetical protein
MQESLPAVIHNHEKYPGKTKEKEDTIQEEERIKINLSLILAHSIKPYDLRYGDKWDGAVTRVE